MSWTSSWWLVEVLEPLRDRLVAPDVRVLLGQRVEGALEIEAPRAGLVAPVERGVRLPHEVGALLLEVVDHLQVVPDRDAVPDETVLLTPLGGRLSLLGVRQVLLVERFVELRRVRVPQRGDQRQDLAGERPEAHGRGAVPPELHHLLPVVAGEVRG